MIGTECPTCKHDRGRLKCAAFPERIPMEILTGEVSHTKPYPGDNDIRYERATPQREEARD